MNELVRVFFHPVIPLNWNLQPKYTSLSMHKTNNTQSHHTCNYISTITAKYSGISQAIIIDILTKHVNDPGSELISHKTKRVVTGTIPTVTYNLFLKFRSLTSLIQPGDDLEDGHVQIIGDVPVPICFLTT